MSKCGQWGLEGVGLRMCQMKQRNRMDQKCISGLVDDVKDLDLQRARKASGALNRSDFSRYMFWKEHSNVSRE